MKRHDKVFKELFSYTDSILISDVNGKVLYYEDYNDQINALRHENVIGRSVFELYPFFKREDFTLFKAIDTKKVIINEYQEFVVNGVQKRALNSAYPLINETGVLGGMVLTVELDASSNHKIRKASQAKYNFENIITQDANFLLSFDRLRKLAGSSFNILVVGETGTGKELIAHTIHANSTRSRQPFIIQNCAAIPDNLMESILFGSSKGSFTGAIDRAGLFEVANGGTLFLDEINSLSLDLQGKLLRAIEEKTIRRIGEATDRDVDVRILASTNQDLGELVAKGSFRKDLFFRLNVTSYTIPPLRERRGDIPLLIDYYIGIYNRQMNRNITGVAPNVMELFHRYRWDGNVRELKSAIEYACIIRSNGEITLSDIPDYMFSQKQQAHSQETMEDIVSPVRSIVKANTSLAEQLDELEKEVIKACLEKNRFSIKHTAEELKISRQTLYNKLKKYNLLSE